MIFAAPVRQQLSHSAALNFLLFLSLAAFGSPFGVARHGNLIFSFMSFSAVISSPLFSLRNVRGLDGVSRVTSDKNGTMGVGEARKVVKTVVIHH